MNTNSLYMDEILSEHVQLPTTGIMEIHDSSAIGIILLKLSISDEIIAKLAEQWNDGTVFPKEGCIGHILSILLQGMLRTVNVGKRRIIYNRNIFSTP